MPGTNPGLKKGRLCRPWVLYKSIMFDTDWTPELRSRRRNELVSLALQSDYGRHGLYLLVRSAMRKVIAAQYVLIDLKHYDRDVKAAKESIKTMFKRCPQTPEGVDETGVKMLNNYLEWGEFTAPNTLSDFLSPLAFPENVGMLA